MDSWRGGDESESNAMGDPLLHVTEDEALREPPLGASLDTGNTTVTQL
jgi:hypothetical protein